MSVFKHKNGYYGYSFMYLGKRYHKTFKGMEKDEVARLEIIHKSELIKNSYNIVLMKNNLILLFLNILKINVFIMSIKMF